MNLVKKPAYGRALLTTLAFIAMGACMVVLLPAARGALIDLGSAVLGRPINRELWQQMLKIMAVTGLFISGALLLIVSKQFETILAKFPAEKRKPYYTAIEFGLIGLFIGVTILIAASNNAI